MQASSGVSASWGEGVLNPASPVLQVPPNTPATQNIQGLSSRIYPSSSSSISSTESHDRVILWGERQKELRDEVVAEAKKLGINLSEDQIAKRIGEKIDAVRWVIRKRKF